MSLKKVFHTAIRVSSWSHAVAIGSIALILSACTDYVDKYEGDYKDDYGDRETFIQNLNSANLDLASVCSSGDWFWCASQDGAYTTSNDGKIETYSSGDVKFTFTGTDDNAYKFSTNELDNDLLPYLRRNGGISVSIEGSGEWDAGLRINTGNYFDLLHEKNVVVAYENSCPGVKINLDVVTAKDYMERGSLVKEGTVLYRYSGELPAGGFQVLTVDPDQLTNEIGDSKWRTAEFSISATENRDRYTSEITIEFTESCPEFKDGKGLNLVGIGLQSTTRSNSGTVKSSSSSGEGGPGNNGGSTVKSSSSLAKSSSSSVKSSSSSVKSSSSSANTVWTVTCKGTPNAGTITWEPQYYYVSALEQATAKYSWTLNGALDSETNTAIKPTVTYLADGEYFAQLSVTVNGQTKTTKCSALIESGASGFLWKGSDKLDLVQTDFGSGSKWYFGTDQEGGGSTTIQFPEINPYDECEGKCGMVWFGNTEYPYATVGFNLDENGTTYDVSAWKGLCIAYYSPEKMYLKLDLQNISDYGSDLPAAELPSLSSMDEYRVENIEWASFKQGGWGNASTISGEEAARILKGVVVTFAGSTGGSQFFNIYQIGSYGMCGNVQPKNVDMSQFRQVSAWDYLNPNISYGEITDSRDGQVYKTTVIDGKRWFAQNLNYADSVATSVLKGNSWCYRNSQDSCTKYGRLYTRAAALEACPSGWHLPTGVEYRRLNNVFWGEYVDGNHQGPSVKYKATKGWDTYGSEYNGTDDFGFTALPGGYYMGTSESFSYAGKVGYFWTSSPTWEGRYVSMEVMYNDENTSYAGVSDLNGYSVRCVEGDAKTSAEDYLNPSLEYDTFTDIRDGKVYKTIKIDGNTWMAQNLNYADSTSTPVLVGNTACLDDNAENCDMLGRLYTWNAAMQACPLGWHLPSLEEFDALKAYVGESMSAYKLKASDGWVVNGTDAVGFSALPAVNAGDRADFWSSYGSDESAHYLSIVREFSEAGLYGGSTTAKLSVRCIKGPLTGTMTDARDGQTYNTVRIGNQIWMAQNLNYAYTQETATLDSSSFCYGNDPANCETFGRLYLWSAAMDSVGLYSDGGLNCGDGTTCTQTEPVQGACPAGWHLPDMQEWETLISFVGGEGDAGSLLKAENGWNGSLSGLNAYSFSALPAGSYYNGGFSGIGQNTGFWSASESDDGSADNLFLHYEGDNASVGGAYLKEIGFSVRCVKD